MNKYYRIIDANINRASEGLRILEDIARFKYNNKKITEKLKNLRHAIRDNIMDISAFLIKERESTRDVGKIISKESCIDNRNTLFELVTANFKRVQEALRSIEETLKMVNLYPKAKLYERYRFSSYTFEKDFYKLDIYLKKRNKLATDLYCLTAQEYSLGRNNIEVVESMIEAGIKLLQYREKEKTLKEKYEECIKIRELTKKHDVTFIINDHLDLAMIAGADGVHLGQDDLPVEEARKIAGEEFIIGLSTHSPKQAQAALKTSVDYIGVGPIFKTYTKKDVCAPVGLEYLEYAVKNVNIPFVAIGGIKENNILKVKKRGAQIIALVTEIVGAVNIKEKIRNLRRILNSEVDINA